MWPGCTCIHLWCLHIFGCKYVYKKTCCPSQKLTLKPVNKPFAKFISVRESTVFLLRWRKKKQNKRSGPLAYQQNITVKEWKYQDFSKNQSSHEMTQQK